jgi:hypothetical protein
MLPSHHLVPLTLKGKKWLPSHRQAQPLKQPLTSHVSASPQPAADTHLKPPQSPPPLRAEKSSHDSPESLFALFCSFAQRPARLFFLSGRCLDCDQGFGVAQRFWLSFCPDLSRPTPPFFYLFSPRGNDVRQAEGGGLRRDWELWRDGGGFGVATLCGRGTWTCTGMFWEGEGDGLRANKFRFWGL